MTVVLKLVYGKDIRRCSLADESLAWPHVLRRINDLLGVDASDMHVTYKDDEGDSVTISSTDELLEAVRLAKASDPALLRLTVRKKGGASPSAATGADSAPDSERRVPPPFTKEGGDVASEFEALLGPMLRRLERQMFGRHPGPPWPSHVDWPGRLCKKNSPCSPFFACPGVAVSGRAVGKVVWDGTATRFPAYWRAARGVPATRRRFGAGSATQRERHPQRSHPCGRHPPLVQAGRAVLPAAAPRRMVPLASNNGFTSQSHLPARACM